MEVLAFVVGVGVILEKNQPDWFWLSVKEYLLYRNKIRIQLNAEKKIHGTTGI